MSEIVAMVFSFITAIVMELVVKDQLLSHEKLVIGVLLTTIAWVATALFTKPTDQKVLVNFYKMIRPHAMGWQPVVQQGIKDGIIIDEHTRTGRLATEISNDGIGLCRNLCAIIWHRISDLRPNDECFSGFTGGGICCIRAKEIVEQYRITIS